MNSLYLYCWGLVELSKPHTEQMGYTGLIKILSVSFLFYWHCISKQAEWTRLGLYLLLYLFGNSVQFSKVLPIYFFKFLLDYSRCTVLFFCPVPRGAVFTFCWAFTLYLFKRSFGIQYIFHPNGIKFRATYITISRLLITSRLCILLNLKIHGTLTFACQKIN